MTFFFRSGINKLLKDEWTEKYVFVDRRQVYVWNTFKWSTYSACETFPKNNDRIRKFKETEDSRYIFQNKLDKAWFQHDLAYRDFKDLPRRTDSDKVFRDKQFNIAKNPKYDVYQRLIISMVYKVFDKNSAAAVHANKLIMLANKSNTTTHIGKEIISENQQLSKEIHKLIIRKFKET